MPEDSLPPQAGEAGSLREWKQEKQRQQQVQQQIPCGMEARKASATASATAGSLREWKTRKASATAKARRKVR
jgi:hypothetical protein